MAYNWKNTNSFESVKNYILYIKGSNVLILLIQDLNESVVMIVANVHKV